jgi:cytosine/adenosine deaminase-related metal-dependent hydrolase
MRDARAQEGGRPMTDLVIDNATLVTMNDARDVIEDGALAIDGGRIVALGSSADVRREHSAATTIDAGGNPVLPGFVNAHFHSYSVLHRGAAYLWEDDLTGFLDIVYRRLLPAVSDPEDRYAVMLLPLVEMIKAGITCTLDLNEWLDVGGVEASLRAFEDAGMRGVVARSLMDGDPWPPPRRCARRPS